MINLKSFTHESFNMYTINTQPTTYTKSIEEQISKSVQPGDLFMRLTNFDYWRTYYIVLEQIDIHHWKCIQLLNDGKIEIAMLHISDIWSDFNCADTNIRRISPSRLSI